VRNLTNQNLLAKYQTDKSVSELARYVVKKSYTAKYQLPYRMPLSCGQTN